MPIETFHETDEDREVEKEIARVFAEKWGLDFFKLPQNHALDVTFHRKGSRKPVIWGECRNRNHAFGQYPDVWCSLRKVEFSDWLRTQNHQTRFLVRWKCGTHAWIDLMAPDEYVVAGRSKEKMRNEEDVEPLAVFKIERFEVIKNAGEGSVEEA